MDAVQLRQVCAQAVRAGFDGIEWVLPYTDARPEHQDPSRDRKGAVEESKEPARQRGNEATSQPDNEAAEQQGDNAPKCPSDHRGWPGIAPGHVVALAGQCVTTEVDEAANTLAAMLHSAAELGARGLNLLVPPIHQYHKGEGFARYQDGLNFCYELLHRARREAEVAGVPIALEVASRGLLLSPVEVREVVDAANSWAVGVCIDVPRVSETGSPTDWIKTLGRRVRAIRLDETSLPADSSILTSHEPSAISMLAEAMKDVPSDRLIIIAGRADPAEIQARLAIFECLER